MASSFFGVIFCVVLAYGVIAVDYFPRTLDQYISLKPGQITTFRVTYANGETGFMTITAVKPNSEGVSYATVFGEGQVAVQVHSVYTNWQGNPGELHNKETYYSRDSETLTLIAQREGGVLTEYSPAISLWSPELLESTSSTPLTGQLTLDGTQYDYALWLDGRETRTLPNGQDKETIRIGLELFLNGRKVYHSLTGYADGVGLIWEEEYDGDGNLIQQLEIVTSTRLEENVSLPVNELFSGAGSSLSFFRENTARTGAYDVDLPDVPFYVAYHLTLDANFTASPVFADGLLFVADQNGTLFALDAVTGNVRWQMGLGGLVAATPAVAEGMVFVGASDKMLYAFTAQSGQFVWAFQLRDNVSTSPAVVDGVLYFGGEDRILYAVDAITGQEKWRFEAGDRIVSSPAVVEGFVVFGADDGIVYALDQTLGIEIWRVALESPVVTTPAIEGEVVYVGATDTEFIAISLESGEQLWKSRTAFGYLASAAVGKELVFVADLDGVVRALNRADGSVQWFWRAGSNSNFISSPLLLGNQLVIVDDEGIFYVFDATTGNLKQSLLLASDGITGSPTWDGETLYLTTQDQRVIALRNDNLGSNPAPSLNPLWELELGSAEAIPFAQPLELDGVIYIITHDGNLLQVNKDTGDAQVYFRFGETIEAAPALDGRRMFVGTSFGNLIAFDMDQRAEIWRQRLAGEVRFAPAVSGGQVFVHARTDTGGVVYGIDTAAGQVIWQFDTQSFGNSSPVIASDYVIVSGDSIVALNPLDGTEVWRVSDFVSFGGVREQEGVVYAVGAGLLGESVIAIQSNTGEVLWRGFAPGTFIFGRPVLDAGNRMLIAGAASGQVFGLDVGSGEVRWQFDLHGSLQSDVQVQNGLVFFSSVDGTLFVLDAATGNLRANARLGTVGTFAPPLVTPERVYALSGAVLFGLEIAP